MDDAAGTIVVGFNKKSLFLILLAAAAFAAIGVHLWVLSNAPNEPAYWRVLLRIVGSFSVIVSGLAFLVILRKHFGRKAALVIDDQGIVDQASPMKIGRIPWSDIENIEISPAAGREWLVIRLNDPDAYLQRVSAWRRHVGAANTRMVGSPVVISPSILDFDDGELWAILTERLDGWRDRREAGPET